MWRAYLIETMTGLVGAEIEMSTNGRHDTVLNQAGAATVTVQKSSLTTIPARWLRPWAQGIMLTFETESEGEQPWFAGPITAPPDEYVDSLSFSVSGIRAVFEQRFLADRDYEPGEIAAFKKGKVAYANRHLAYIAQDLVRRGMDKKAGFLPIRFATPVSSGAGGHDRTYNNYDLANNTVDKRLSELSDVIGGPDVMFRPEWVDTNDRRFMRWAMHTGTEYSPVIPQEWEMVIDGSAPLPQISELTMNIDGSHYSTRAFATGTGEGTGIAMAMRENDRLLADQHPLLESAESFDSVSKTATLAAYASASVDIRPFVEIHVTIDASDIRSPLGRWQVGDTAILKPGSWLTIPNREVRLRILRVSGDFDTPHVTIYFQEDQW